MARLFASDVTAAALAGANPCELETLKRLAKELPNDYSVYHSVHWSRYARDRSSHGEVDFVIVNRSGDVFVIEQKNGLLEETAGGLAKSYADGPKTLNSQIERNLWNLKDRFKRQLGTEETLEIDYLVYCPDHRVVKINAPGIDKSRTIDATRKDCLVTQIEQRLGPGVDRPDNWTEIVCEFFAQTLHIVPDVSSYVVSQERVYTQMLEGLEDAIGKIEFSPYRLRVIGSAGCGKSQLTLRYCAEQLGAGKRPVTLCFNRPLADRLRALAPRGAVTDTYYGFCKETLESLDSNVTVRPTQEPGFWRDLQEQLIGIDIPERARIDALIVDEGQDFEQEWWEILQLFLAKDASVLWLEDPLQNLRRTGDVDLGEGFVTYREDANFRTPSSIGDVIRKVLDVQFSQRNQLPGLGVHVERYKKPAEQQKLVAHRVNNLRKEGFSNEEIVIISCRGMSHATFASCDTVGALPLRRFTGDYTSDGEQIYTDGRLYFDTIQRFKGQQAPAVILVDVDETLGASDYAKRVLYCGMTRATVRLEMLVHEDNQWLSKLEAA